MNIERRLRALEQRIGAEADGALQPEYCSWQPWESPPTIPTGIRLSPATERARAELMAMDESIPYCE